MIERVVTVSLDDDLRTIRDLFAKAHFHHLMVVDDDDALVGIISDRDLFLNLSPFIETGAEDRKDLSTLTRRAHQIMSRDLVTAPPEMTVPEAARLLVRSGISCLPILDQGQLIGVVTWKDLLRVALG